MDDKVIIFVRHKRTSRYLDANEGWTERLPAAQKFPSTWDAVEFCIRNNIRDAQVVMRMGPAIYDITFDIP